MIIHIKEIANKLYTHRVKLIVTMACFIMVAIIMVMTASGANNVLIKYNGEEYEVRTYRTNAVDIIEQSRIGLNLDECHIDDSKLEEYGIIYIDDLCHLTVKDGDKTQEIVGYGTVSTILKENGIVLGEHDEIEGADLDSYTKSGTEITIKHAFSVMISADGEITTVYMTEGPVSKALDLAVLTADDDDIISKPLDEILTQNSSLEITRIEKKERVENEVIKFNTKTEKTNTLNVGQSKVTQKGINGEKIVTYEDKYVNGKLSESIQVKSEITKKAVDEIKLVGTKGNTSSFVESGPETNLKGVKLASGIRTISSFAPPASLELTADNTPVSYKRKIVGNATAYHCGTHTSTGKAVRTGYVAVNPKQIPYHTPMWIVSNDGKFVYGYCFAEDTGGFIHFTGKKKTLCDLYMPTLASCSDFGRRAVTIYIL